MSGLIRVIPMLVCMGVIFFFSHQPGDNIDLPQFVGADKVSHAVAYGVLSLSVIFAFPKEFRARRRGLVFGAAVLICTLYGVSDEYHQSFVDGRTTELADLFADAAGALLVALVWFFKSTHKQRDKVTIS